MAEKPIRYLIRADGDEHTGMGHIMRCLALAQAIQRSKGRAVFATSTRDKWSLGLYKAAKAEIVKLNVRPGSVQDLKETEKLFRSKCAEWVILDGYLFHPEYQASLKALGAKILIVDDKVSSPHYYADIILNQNIHAEAADYASREVSSRLLLGPKYALLREEFRRASRIRKRIVPEAKRILVTLGGSDEHNVTTKVLRALGEIENKLQVVVVIGPGNSHAKEIAAAVKALRHRVSIMRDVRAMSKWMKWADLAVSAAGSTVWELACLGVPSILIITADNQRASAEWLGRKKVMLNLGCQSKLSEVALCEAAVKLIGNQLLRKQFSARAASLVDGGGTQRVIKALQTHRRPGSKILQPV